MNEFVIKICMSLALHYVRTALLLLLLLFPISNILYWCIKNFWEKCTRKKHKSDMVNDEIASYIDSYLEMNAPGFSVFINGEWGSGKTYFIKQYKPNSKSHKKSCYVSLFGISSKGEFEFALWKGILCSSYNIGCTLLWTLLSITISFGFILYDLEALASIDFWSFSIPILASIVFAGWCFARLKLRDIMLGNRYLVLDDFERAEVDYPILMAWISELVEHRCCPVVIIGNEQEIMKKLKYDNKPEQNTSTGNADGNQEKHPTDSFAYKQYKRIKEKVIGKEFSLHQNDDHVIKALISRLPPDSVLQKILDKNIDWFIATLLKPLHQNKIATNYRALEHVMRNFDWHFSGVEQLVKNEKLWHLLLPRYFSIMYYKEVGELFDADFSSEFVKEILFVGGNSSEAEKKFLACYPFWGDLQKVLSDDSWMTIVEDKPVDSEDVARTVDYLFNPPKLLIPKWYSVWNLDDDKIVSLINETEIALRNHEIHSPEDIIYLAEAMLEMQEVGGLHESKEDIRNSFYDYIDQEANSKEFALLLRSREAYRSQMRKVSRGGGNGACIIAIRERLLAKMNDVVTKGTQSMFKEMLNVLHNKESLEHWFDSDNRKNLDIYSGNSPQILWNKLDKIPTVAFNAALDNFQVYLMDFTTELINLSEEGFKFWDEFLVFAKERRHAWTASRTNIMKNVHLGHFIDDVDPALDKHAKSKNITRQGENNGQDDV